MLRKYPHSVDAAQRRAHLQAFSELLQLLRREAGHPSARDFYRSNGGRAHFLCTYEQYLNVESGRSAPTPGLLEKIAVALQIWLHEGKNRELFLVYLRLVLGSENLFEMVAQAIREAKNAAAAPPLRQALQRDLETRRRPVTQEQADAMYADPVSYWLSVVFCNDGGEWTAAELAQLLGYPESAIRTSAQRYLKTGFLVASKDGKRFRCFASGKVLVIPRRTPHLPPEPVRRCERLNEEMARKRGCEELRESLYLKCYPSGIRQYYSYLARTVAGASVYSTADRGPDTAFYQVQTIVRKLFSIKKEAWK